MSRNLAQEKYTIKLMKRYTHKQTLDSLLLENRGIFHLDGDQLGSVGLVEQEIPL